MLDPEAQQLFLNGFSKLNILTTGKQNSLSQNNNAYFFNEIVL